MHDAVVGEFIAQQLLQRCVFLLPLHC